MIQSILIIRLPVLLSCICHFVFSSYDAFVLSLVITSFPSSFFSILSLFFLFLILLTILYKNSCLAGFVQTITSTDVVFIVSIERTKRLDTGLFCLFCALNFFFHFCGLFQICFFAFSIMVLYTIWLSLAVLTNSSTSMCLKASKNKDLF